MGVDLSIGSILADPRREDHGRCSALDGMETCREVGSVEAGGYELGPIANLHLGQGAADWLFAQPYGTPSANHGTVTDKPTFACNSRH
jgi:hypothetical protein